MVECNARANHYDISESSTLKLIDYLLQWDHASFNADAVFELCKVSIDLLGRHIVSRTDIIDFRFALGSSYELCSKSDEYQRKSNTHNHASYISNHMDLH